MSTETMTIAGGELMELPEANQQPEKVGLLGRLRNTVSGLINSSKARIAMAALMAAPAGGCLATQGIEDQKYWKVGVGAAQQKMNAETDIAPFNLNLGVTNINGSLLHGPDVNLAFLPTNGRILDAGYRVGVGPNMGYWHVFAGAGLGWAHTCDEKGGNLHGLRVRFDLGASAGIPPSALPNNLQWLAGDQVRLFASGGGSILAAQSGGADICSNACSGVQGQGGVEVAF